MAIASGTEAAPLAALLRRLAAEPYRFDLFQALRRLECAFPDRPRWGESRHVRDDPTRLGQEPSLAFAPSALASFERRENGGAGRLRVHYPGLFGPNGPLPLHLTEFARERQANEHDHTFSRFVDVFHHRLLALFYRAWATAQPAVQYDRPESDRYALFIGAFLGMGSPVLRRRGSWQDRVLLHHAGDLAVPTHHAEGLSSMLADVFRTRVEIRSFVGHWIELPADAPCRLGSGLGNAALGRTTTVGERVWDCQHKFRIAIGPIDFAGYSRLLPGGESLERLAVLVRSYAGEELFWDVNVILRKEEVPPLRLGGPARLGWTTWLLGRPAREDAGELVLDPAGRAA